MTTFVSVGNATLPFFRLIDAVVGLAPRLPQPVVLQHGNTAVQTGNGFDLRAFVDMEEFARLVEQAELLIMHAGAGSVIHAIQAGKTPVIMPRRAKYHEHVDDHQAEFAVAMENAGKAILAAEPRDLVEAVQRALGRTNDKKSAGENPRMIALIGGKLSEYAEESNKSRGSE